jgi:hypothetical protein
LLFTSAVAKRTMDLQHPTIDRDNVEMHRADRPRLPGTEDRAVTRRSSRGAGSAVALQRSRVADLATPAVMCTLKVLLMLRPLVAPTRS